MICKCGSTGVNINPVKGHNKPVFACQTCGAVFSQDGATIVENLKDMNMSHVTDMFRGPSAADAVLNTKDPLTKTILFAQMVNYGYEMWFDGLKQGLLLNVISNNRRGKDGEIGS